MVSEYDLVAIGAGPAGYAGAIRAAQLGMKTAVVEADRVGGICLNWGCIPTKAILHCAEAYELARATAGRADCGVRCEAIGFDFGAVIEKSRQAADRLGRGVEALFRRNKIDLIQGRGCLADRQTVVVTGPAGGEAEQTIRARRILLATGAQPQLLRGVEADGERVLTSRHALALREAPASIVIVGAGPVGLEFAHIYATYGAKVTVVEMESQVLPGIDGELANGLEKALARKGIAFLTQTTCRGIEVAGTGVRALVASPTGEQRLKAERLLVAAGSTPNTEGLRLEALGIATEKGFVRVGPGFRTTCETVWAAGDLIGPPLLAHAAMAEAVAAVEAMAGRGDGTVRYEMIPACVYCQPELATIGLSEQRARAEHANVGVARLSFAANGKAVAVGQTDGFVKLVFDTKSGAIFGCHILGYGATEMINQIAMAMSADLTVEQLARAIYAHPTASEIIGETALAALGQSGNSRGES